MDWIIEPLTSPVFTLLAKTLLHFLWQGTLVAAVLLVLLQNIPVKLAQLRYVLALGALALCVCLPFLTFSILEGASNEVIVTPADGGVLSIDSVSAVRMQPTLLDVGWLPLLGLIWMTGVIALSLQLMVKMYHVYRLPYIQTFAPSDELVERFEQLLHQLDANRFTRLLVSHHVDVPMVIGWLKPVVLLPASMAVGLTPKQLDMLLVHELAHVKRYDYLVNFLQTWVEVVLFFHPFVKWISRQIRIEREYCCDDYAVDTCGSPVAYATALTDAEMTRPHNIPQLAMAATGGDLKKRVFRVVGHQYCSPKASGHWIAGGLAATIALAIVIALFSARNVVGMQHQSELPITNSNVETEKPKKQQESATSLEFSKQSLTKTEIKRNNDSEPLHTTVTDVSKVAPSPKIDVAEQAKVQTPAAIDVVESVESVETQVASKTQPQANASSTIADAVKPVQPFAEQPSVAEKVLLIPAAEEQPELVEPVAVIDLTVSTSAENDATTDTQEVIEETVASVEPDVIESPEADSLLQPSETNEQQVQQTPVVPEVSTPKAIKIVTPSYPKIAIKKQLICDIRVRFVVNTLGEVERIEFDQKVHRSFRRSISRALKDWSFEPGTVDGVPTNMEMTKIFSFTDPQKAWAPITGSRIARM